MGDLEAKFKLTALPMEFDADYRFMQSVVDEIRTRTALYLELLACAFIKQTGIAAQELVLTMSTYPSANGVKYEWYFRRGDKVANAPVNE